MSALSCKAPLSWETLLDYWLGELGPEAEAAIEEHYLACDVCSRRLERLAALARDVRTLVQTGGVTMVIDERLVRKLVQDGTRVREYQVPLNGSVNCTVTQEDDIVVGCLEAPLEGLKRVDMLTSGIGAGEIRQNDIPFVGRSGRVVFSPPVEALRALPATTVRVRLLAVDNDGERLLGEYAFNHTPHRPV
jgi:hypothetical protein